MGDLLRLTKELNVKSCDLKITSNILAELIKLIDDNKISTTVGKEVFEEMFKTGNSPIKIVEEKGLSQISDTSELTSIIENILDTNPKSIEDFKLGKSKAAGFLMGQIMKATKGKANPKVANEMLAKALKNR